MKKIIILILLLLITGCGENKEKFLVANKVNINDQVIEDKQINSFITSNTSVIFDQGITTFKTNITNNGEDIFINNLNVKFKNKNGTEIVTLKSNLNKAIKNNQSENIQIITDIDLSNAYSIEYHID